MLQDFGSRVELERNGGFHQKVQGVMFRLVGLPICRSVPKHVYFKIALNPESLSPRCILVS